MQISNKLTFSRSTKGTHVYDTDDDSAAVRNVYVKRSAIDGEPPQEITLTISDGADGPKQRQPRS